MEQRQVGAEARRARRAPGPAPARSPAPAGCAERPARQRRCGGPQVDLGLAGPGGAVQQESARSRRARSAASSARHARPPGRRAARSRGRRARRQQVVVERSSRSTWVKRRSTPCSTSRRTTAGLAPVCAASSVGRSPAAPPRRGTRPPRAPAGERPQAASCASRSPGGQLDARSRSARRGSPLLRHRHAARRRAARSSTAAEAGRARRRACSSASRRRPCSRNAVDDRALRPASRAGARAPASVSQTPPVAPRRQVRRQHRAHHLADRRQVVVGDEARQLEQVAGQDRLEVEHALERPHLDSGRRRDRSRDDHAGQAALADRHPHAARPGAPAARARPGRNRSAARRAAAGPRLRRTQRRAVSARVTAAPRRRADLGRQLGDRRDWPAAARAAPRARGRRRRNPCRSKASTTTWL